MFLIKMYLALKLKVSSKNQDEPNPLFWELWDLARNDYPVEVVRNEILLTTFNVGFSNPALQWELRKPKPADSNAAPQAAMETHSFLEIDGFKLQTSDVNKSNTETPLDNLTELVRSLLREIQDAVAKPSRNAA